MKKILSKIALMIVLTSGIVVGAACLDKQTQQANLDIQWESVSEVEDLKINTPIPAALLRRKVLVQGEQKNYDSLNIIYPDGTAKTYSEGEPSNLDQVGKYTFIYVKCVGDKVYSDEEVRYVQVHQLQLKGLLNLLGKLFCFLWEREQCRGNTRLASR